MSNARVQLTFNLNEPQQATFKRLLDAFNWCDSANIVIRKDGVNMQFEADWLYASDVNATDQALARRRDLRKLDAVQ